MSKKMKVVFTLSVLANLLLAGLVIGHSAKRWGGPPPALPSAENLSADSAALIRKAFEEERPALLPLIEEMRGVKSDLMDAVSAETFDTQAFDTAARKMKTTLGKMTAQRLDMFKSVSEQLPQEDRVKFADKFVRFIQGYGKLMYKPMGPGFGPPPPAHGQPWKDGFHKKPSEPPSGDVKPEDAAKPEGYEDDFGYVVFPNGDIDLDGDMVPDYSFGETPEAPVKP
ncbi:MAG: periplasmic heavy metal sensor [Alphaproteobacteria bacterium]|nr:periplasmic heavy metal sensor [Alphaproteobacteria bacterium]MBP7759614.1 periplasmic heavy metal sensor [Alphaproteobacteria bacterium]MBP7763153.1 periplasmic heavy metal sensor [Alphaproteobacteria bacterium]MBP7904612.1 periplasmic heavy metal sensor [Alphaproteobacteria bacterium]